MKKQFLALVALVITFNVTAQTKRKTKLNIGLEIATPATDQFFTTSKVGFGGTAKLLFPQGKRSYVTATTGFIAFPGRAGSVNEIFGPTAIGIANVNIAHPALSIIPVKIGYQTPFSAKSKWYAEAELGYTFADVLGLVQVVKPGDVGGFTAAMGFGFRLNKGIELSWRYEALQTRASRTNYTSFVSLRSLVNIDW
jgi:hypothetical protein